MTPEAERELLDQAQRIREKAYAPYSKFLVGAILKTSGGKTFPGVNVENASYGLTICAERSAIVSAISAGEHNFEAIAVVADTKSPVSPCGACRQVLAEFGGDIQVIMGNLSGDYESKTVATLLPGFFDSRALHSRESHD